MTRFAITIFLLLATAAANHAFSRPEAEIARSRLNEFPAKIGDWKMVGEQRIDEKSMEILGVDDYIMRTYANGNGVFIGMYIGYFETQREGKQIHSPRQCLPGAGWLTIRHEEQPLALKGKDHGNVLINFDLMEKGSDRDVYLWWYQGRGRIYPSEYLNKAYLIWDRLTKGRTDGALVRVNSRANPNAERALGELTAFINLMTPQLPLYVPD